MVTVQSVRYQAIAVNCVDKRIRVDAHTRCVYDNLINER